MIDREKIRDNFNKWKEEFSKPGTSGADALERMESHFSNLLDEDDLEALKNKVLQACFFAEKIHRGEIDDLGIDGRSRMRDIELEIPNHLKTIDKILKFMKKFPDFAKEIALNKGFYEEYSSLEESLEEYKKKYPDLSKTKDFEKDFYEKCPSSKQYLELYKEGIKEYSNNVKPKPGETNRSEYSTWHLAGPLKFPDSIAKQFEKKDPEVNGLLFSLAFIFRTYTTPTYRNLRQLNPEEAIKEPISGKMPKYGKPRYELVENFANAVFYPEGMEQDEKKEYSVENIKLRIAELIKKEAYLKPWWFTPVN